MFAGPQASWEVRAARMGSLLATTIQVTMIVEGGNLGHP